jgi:hypothetical protein
MALALTAFCVLCAAICLGVALWFRIGDRRAKPSNTATEPSQDENPVRPQAGFPAAGIGKIGEAFSKLDNAGQLLLASVAFTVAATVVMSVIAAVSKK